MNYKEITDLINQKEITFNWLLVTCDEDNWYGHINLTYIEDSLYDEEDALKEMCRRFSLPDDITSDGFQIYEHIISLFGSMKLVSEIGGGEGQGDLVERVIYFEDFDIYAKFNGYYSSLDGITWNYNSFEEVFPLEVKVIKYFNKADFVSLNK